MGKHVPYNDSEPLNNFFCNFPFGAESIYPRGTRRHHCAARWQRTMRDHLETIRHEFITDESFMEYCGRYSDKYLDQTPEQFFAEVDATVVEVGLTDVAVTEQVATHVLKQKKLSQEESRIIVRRMQVFLKPIYIALRNKGYNWADLAA